MEPLNTFFKISPSLLGPIVSTPHSGTSSSFSSPSFADHQTGLKLYRDSPASLTSYHQVVDDNPLFEGFPVLQTGAHAVEDELQTTAEQPEETAVQPASGRSAELQEQLHHLVSSLQRALELHNANGLPDGLGPQLADELEAMARKLKEKERELPVERQLRTKVQAVLSGAAVTIQKLRSGPPTSSLASRGGVSWRYSSAYEESPTATPSHRNGGGAGQLRGEGGSRRRGRGDPARDSVCKQLLQSPSIAVSPLVWQNPETATRTPLLRNDGASMVSPKELPLEFWDPPSSETQSQLQSQSGSLFQPGPAPRSGASVSIRQVPPMAAPVLVSGDVGTGRSAGDAGTARSGSELATARTGGEPATARTGGDLAMAGTWGDMGTARSIPDADGQSSPHPALYSWMKAALASSTKPDHSVQSGWESSVWGDTNARTTPLHPGQSPGVSPGAAAEPGDGLAAAVRAALASTRTPLLYGSPLHLRIQRLLAEQKSPSPLGRDLSPAFEAGSLLSHRSAEGLPLRTTELAASKSAAAQDRGAGQALYGLQFVWSQASRLVAAVDSPRNPAYDTDTTTSSCATPIAANEGDLASLHFRTIISPIGPPLRERFAARPPYLPVAATTRDCVSGSLYAEVDGVPTTCGPAVGAGAGQGVGGGPASKEAEAQASALVAELGLDLSLDPQAAESFSKLEVLEHVERWARGQYIAAQWALARATPEAGRWSEAEGNTVLASGTHACWQGIRAMQAEGGATASVAGLDTQREAPPSRTNDTTAGVMAPPLVAASPSTRRHQRTKPVSWRQSDGWKDDNGAAADDDDIRSDICSPARSDQVAKHSPARLRLASPAPAGTAMVSPNKGSDGAGAAWRSVAMDAGTPSRRRQATDEFVSTPTRRGLFRAPSALPSGACSSPLSAGKAWEEGEVSPPDATSSVDVRGHAVQQQQGSTAEGAPGAKQSEVPDEQQHQAQTMKAGARAEPREVAAERGTTGVSQGRSDLASPLRTCRPGPEVLLTPGHQTGSGGRHHAANQPASAAASSDAPSPDNMPPVGPHANDVGVQHSPAMHARRPSSFKDDAARAITIASPAPGHGMQHPSRELDEASTEVQFTPGEAAPSGSKGPSGRHRSRVFTGLSGVHFSGVDSEVQSAKTLSSISSVSILELDPELEAGETGTGAADSPSDAARPPPKAAKQTKRIFKPSLPKPLKGLFSSLIGCAHKKKVS